MNPLTSLPPNVRVALYWVGYVVGVLGQGLTIVWGAIAAASPDVSMPLGLVIASAVIGLLQTQLNLLAGSNVPSYVDVIEGDAPPPVVRDERGEIHVGVSGAIALLVGIFLVLAILHLLGVDLRGGC